MSTITNSYQEYLVFKSVCDLENDQDYLEAFKFFKIKERKLGQFNDNYILNKYFESKYEDDDEQENRRYYNLEFNVIREFPIEMIKKLLELNFNTRDICYMRYLHIELVKYIFYIWNDTSHELHYMIDKIKDHLIEVAGMNEDDYYDILNNGSNPRYNPDKNYMYYTWWLYPYFPLLEDGENLILKLTSFAYLDDAQDMLMYGIYQMDPHRLYGFFKKFMQELHTAVSFKLFESGTGSLGQFRLIAKKLYESGYDIINDKDIDYVYKFTDRTGNECDYRSYHELLDIIH